jgi:hypothetical protein
VGKGPSRGERWGEVDAARYNPGTIGPADETVDWALARPVIRRDLGQIWFVTTFGGFRAVEFEAGLWPNAGDACPLGHDDFQAQYDPGYDACRAGSGKG